MAQVTAEIDRKKCSNPGCNKHNGLKACKGCKLVFYCSKRCQKTHWSNGVNGHRSICKQLKWLHQFNNFNSCCSESAAERSFSSANFN